LGRYVPGFETLSILFNTDEGLDVAYKLYHRLIAGEYIEARRIFREESASLSPTEVIDNVLIPQLLLTEADSHRRLLTADTYARVVNGVSELAKTLKADRSDAALLHVHVEIASVSLDSERVVADLLGDDLSSRGGDVRVISPKALTSEIVAAVSE